MSVTAIGQITATTLTTQLTAVGSANTKGDWTEISSSTPAAATGILLSVFCGGADDDVLVDIGTGAAASESVLVENIYCPARNTTFNIGFNQFIPVAIAAGTRVSARYQGTTTNATCFIGIHLLNNSGEILIDNCTPVTYGANTTDSGGTSVDPGASTNTKGAYSVLSASTTADIDWITVMFGGQENSAASVFWWFVDIATGAESSETVVIPNIVVRSHTGLDNVFVPPYAGPFPVTIASGTRLTARAQCLGNDATDRLIDVIVIGYNGTAAAGGSGGGGFSAWMG